MHQFLTGLPNEVSKQLRATGVTGTLKTARKRAKILMTVEQHTPTNPLNPVTTAQTKFTTKFLQIQQQVTELTAQVAALTTRSTSPRTPPAFIESRPKQCFICNRVGHLQYNCPTCQDPKFCFTCGQQAHGWRTCPQGNGQGAAAWGSSRPHQ